MNAERRKKIFGLAKGLGLTGDKGREDLHALVLQQTGQESIAALTDDQADQVIRYLRQLNGQQQVAAAHRPGRATAPQIWKQRELARELGWTDQQLIALVKRMARAKVDRLEWQTFEDASNVIEALKKMTSRAGKVVNSSERQDP